MRMSHDKQKRRQEFRNDSTKKAFLQLEQESLHELSEKLLQEVHAGVVVVADISYTQRA